MLTNRQLLDEQVRLQDRLHDICQAYMRGTDREWYDDYALAVASQPAAPEAIAAAILNAHRRGLPDNLRQWALDQSAEKMANSWLAHLATL